MRFALVQYTVAPGVNDANVKVTLSHYGHMPNMSLLHVAAVLEREGVDILFIDPEGMELTQREVDAKLQAFDPDFVGLSCFTNKIHTSSRYAAHCRTVVPRAKIIVGGAHAWDFPEDTLRHNPDFDYACVGEAEMVMPEFLRRIAANESLEGLKGIVWRDGDALRFAGRPELNRDLDSRPFPARHLAPNHKYFNFISVRRNYTIMNTSQGCPFSCIFCNAGRTKWRARSAANVVAEFEECYEKYGVREIDIFDAMFTVNKQRVMDICRLLVEKGLHRKIIWNVRSRVDSVSEEMLEALREAGCYRIFYGIESGDPEMLERLRKGVSIDRIEQIIRKTAKLGISSFGYFAIGGPGETKESIQRTVDFAKRLPLDFVQISVLTAHPRTELYTKHYLPHIPHDFWEEYLRNPALENQFIGRPWTPLSDAELERLAHKAINDFYFRPTQIVRALRWVRSFDQLKRYVAAGTDMALSYALGR